MMTRPTLKELYEQIRQDIASSLGITRLVRFSVIAVLAKALAAVSHSLYGYIETLAKNLLPDSASRQILERWAAIWGIYRKAASPASGQVVFRGVSGSLIPKDALLQDDQGLRYQTLESQRIVAGEARLLVRAITAGKAGNLEAGLSLSLINPIAGIQSMATVDFPGLSSGVDIEDDSSLRSRLLDRIRNPPQGGAAHDYVNWAREIPGVTRSWVFPLYLGAGTVGVTFVLDSQPNIIPLETSDVFKDVEAHIKSKAPITARISVFSPIPKLVRPKIRLIPDHPEVRDEVIAELKDLFFRSASVGGAYLSDGTIFISKMREAISIAQGELDHDLIYPTENIEVGRGEIAILDEIEWIS